MKKEPSKEDIEIGQRIVLMRETLYAEKITGLDLANKIGVSRGAVGNWERGQGIKRENLQKIATAYRISFDWLATGSGTMKGQRDSIDRMLEQLPPDFADDLYDEVRDFAETRIRTKQRELDRSQ